MLKKILLTIFITASQNVFAHEGHDHGTVQAPKGGIIRSLETVHLELITKGNLVSIYAYDTKLKPEEVNKFPVSLTVTLPKKSPQTLEIKDKGDHWEAEFDAKGAHRYTLMLSIKQGGHDDKVKFTVEPKK